MREKCRGKGYISKYKQDQNQFQIMFQSFSSFLFPFSSQLLSNIKRNSASIHNINHKDFVLMLPQTKSKIQSRDEQMNYYHHHLFDTSNFCYNPPMHEDIDINPPNSYFHTRFLISDRSTRIRLIRSFSSSFLNPLSQTLKQRARLIPVKNSM